MLKLSDFFQPLNPVNILVCLLALIFFEVFGTFIKHYFIKDEKVNSETHIVNWLIGLGIFVFVWFAAGFIITPSQLNIQISILIMIGISLPYYISHKEYKPLLNNLKSFVLPLVLFLPFLRPVFVKASLPPYVWDEMAYHFISPYTSLHNIGEFWHFGNGGFYSELPRLMDTLYILSFSLTRTYSVVRLIQFSIFFTAILCSFILVKRFFGSISAFIFILICLSLSIAIPTLTTIGYVDVAALSFLLIGLTFGIAFFKSDDQNHLILSILFWAMSIGTKYTTVTAFAAFIISFGIAYWIKHRTFKKIIDKNTFLKILIGLIIFGGYWYIKNFVLYGNPIYPFLFPCWGKFAQSCGTGASFFVTWTGPVNLYTFYSIITSLLPGNAILHFVLVLSPFLIIIFGNRKDKITLLMLMLSFGLEMIFVKYFSGFDGRYQQYLMFTLIFIVLVFISSETERLFSRVVKRILIIAVITSCTFVYVQNILSLNNNKYLSSNEIGYMKGSESVYGWVEKHLPDVSEAVFWCENPANGPIALARFDPNMVWYSYSGLMRIFLVNCYYDDPNIKPEEWRNFITIAKERKLQFWTISVSPCFKEENIKPEEKVEDVVVEQMKQLNNEIVCNSAEIVPNLYYFDYKKLK